MAKLTVLFNMAESHQLHLLPDREYLVGRQDTCDIVLKEFPGLSRQHFKIYHDGQSWQVTLISKYGDLIHNGQATQQIKLDSKTQFSLGPYTFTYEASAPPPANIAHSGHHEDVVNKTARGLVPANDPLADSDQAGFDEVTAEGVLPTIPYLRVRDATSGREEVLRLEGRIWTGGRDQNCEIVIKDPGASRRHFEIIQEHGEYLVADLGSSNGTRLNGEPLEPNISTPLRSGDTLELEDTTITFELRDPAFENKLAVIPSSLKAPATVFAPPGPMPQTLPANFPDSGVLRVPPATSYSTHGRARSSNKNAGPIRLILIVLIGAIITYGVLNNKSNQQTTNASHTTPSAFDKLSEANKIFVKQSYELARNLYMQQKYEMARAQLQKLHSVIEVYEESREIERHVDQGIRLIHDREELLRVQQDQEKLRQEVERIVQHCQRQLQNSKSSKEAEACLLPATIKNPDHSGIRALIEMVSARESAELQRQQSKEYQMQRAAEARTAYQKALDLHKSGKTKEAIAAYQSLISSSLPNTDQVKDKAKDSIDSINAEIARALKEKVKQAEAAYSKQDDRAAIVAADAALKIDPRSRDAAEVRNQARQRLNKALKVIFEDSVIEEGFGNVEAAKEKWYKIIEMDLEGAEYYQKAKQKLGRYGG